MSMRAKTLLPKDKDLANVGKALKRAARHAREVAEKTQTPCYVIKGGKIVDIMKRINTAQHKAEKIKS